MIEDDELLSVVRQWVQKAENDLKNATYTLRMGEDCPTDTVCFHAQQCAEKYVKALLVLQGLDFPRTHDMSQLIALLPVQSRPTLTPEEQERLTDYATVTRYPGDYEPISLTETRQALRTARQIRSAIRKRLPKKIL
ncbi:MAG TPA: HEPN domain-containing protein [Candidatus Tectomicrobia bacterium]